MDNFGHLKQLMALAETGNFRKAGERLGITHSAISQTVTKLEGDYGVELFSRQRNKSVPTAFGQRIIDAAKTALAEMEKAERDIGLMRNLEGGRLVIGVDSVVGEGLLAPALARLMNTHPKLKFNVNIWGWEDVEQCLRSGSVDIYVGLQPDRQARGISYRPLKLAPPVVACSSEHPVASKATVTVSELLDYPIVGGNVPDWFLEQIRRAYPDDFESLDAMRSIFLTSEDLGLLRQILRTTHAVAILPHTLIRHDIEAGTLTMLTVERYPFLGVIPGVIAHLEGRPLPPSASRLMAEIESFLDEARLRDGLTGRDHIAARAECRL